MTSKLGRLVALLSTVYPLLSLAGPPLVSDPCAKIAGLNFVPPADALACYKAFPFNETLRDNVLANAAHVLDFYTFENYYLNSPPPFQESTVDIRATLAKFGATKFATDYDFNKALYDFVTQLNDGHTRYFPACYNAFMNILPAPVVSLEENGVQNLFIAPDSVEFISQFGADYKGYFDRINFNWKRLAGAKIMQIEGMNPYDYVDFIARTVSGNYLDHGVRVNSVFTSYFLADATISQRLGDLAGQVDVTRTSLNMKLVTVNSTKVETVQIPYLANYTVGNNCAANNLTNGIDLRQLVFNDTLNDLSHNLGRRQAEARTIDMLQTHPRRLSSNYLPTASQVNLSGTDIKSFILPDGKTGVMFVGQFVDIFNFQNDVVTTVDAFKAAGVQQVIIDLTGNGGGIVLFSAFLFQYLSGSQTGYPGFVSTLRANPLAQKIVATHTALGQNNNLTFLFYSPTQWAFLNDTVMSATFDYIDPSSPFVVNGKNDPTSQRLHDISTQFFDVPIPETPPFDLSKDAIVSNGNCASTCALFSTLMFEKHQTKIAVFGGKPGEKVEFKGMAGNQVLDWRDLDIEIKSIGLKADPLAPPDLLVDANFRHNWRTVWSFLNENRPIEYVSELPLLRFPYTKDTYNNPQNLWTFAATKLFE